MDIHIKHAITGESKPAPGLLGAFGVEKPVDGTETSILITEVPNHMASELLFSAGSALRHVLSPPDPIISAEIDDEGSPKGEF